MAPERISAAEAVPSLTSTTTGTSSAGYLPLAWYVWNESRVRPRVSTIVELLGQELVGHLDRLVEQAAAVVAQVDQELLHPLASELVDGVGHLAAGAAGELGEQDVAGVRASACRPAAPWSAGSRRGSPTSRSGSGRPRRTMVILTCVPLGPLSFCTASSRVMRVGGLALDGADHVAGLDAHARGRRALDRRDDGELAVAQADQDAEPVEAGLLLLAHALVGLGREEAGVRVERRAACR